MMFFSKYREFIFSVRNIPTQCASTVSGPSSSPPLIPTKWIRTIAALVVKRVVILLAKRTVPTSRINFINLHLDFSTLRLYNYRQWPIGTHVWVCGRATSFPSSVCHYNNPVCVCGNLREINSAIYGLHRPSVRRRLRRPTCRFDWWSLYANLHHQPSHLLTLFWIIFFELITDGDCTILFAVFRHMSGSSVPNSNA